MRSWKKHRSQTRTDLNSTAIHGHDAVKIAEQAAIRAQQQAEQAEDEAQQTEVGSRSHSCSADRLSSTLVNLNVRTFLFNLSSCSAFLQEKLAKSAEQQLQKLSVRRLHAVACGWAVREAPLSKHLVEIYIDV